MTARPNTAAELAALRATVEGYMKAVERDRIEAKEQRDSMAQDIAAIRSNAVQIDNRVSNIEADMKTVKPVIARVNSWQSMAMGAAIVFALMASAVGLFWEAVKEKAISIFSGNA